MWCNFFSRTTITTTLRTDGSVHKAQNKITGETVSIKKMKKNFYTWEEAVSLREVCSLKKLDHPNIVKLKEVLFLAIDHPVNNSHNLPFYSPKHTKVVREKDSLFFVYEYMDQNVLQVLSAKGPLDEKTIKIMILQLLNGTIRFALLLHNMHPPPRTNTQLSSTYTRTGTSTEMSNQRTCWWQITSSNLLTSDWPER